MDLTAESLPAELNLNTFGDRVIISDLITNLRQIDESGIAPNLNLFSGAGNHASELPAYTEEEQY
jgi:hypothetical protein